MSPASGRGGANVAAGPAGGGAPWGGELCSSTAVVTGSSVVVLVLVLELVLDSQLRSNQLPACNAACRWGSASYGQAPSVPLAAIPEMCFLETIHKLIN